MEHIFVDYTMEGDIEKVYIVYYDGSKMELLKLIEDSRSYEEIYDPNIGDFIANPNHNPGLVLTRDILDSLSIGYRNVSYVIDSPVTGLDTRY